MYFDNLVVSHKRGPVVEQTDYYAFGLEIPGISSRANLSQAYADNRRKYNGIEETKELGLEQYDAFFRNLDPEIGRWKQIDPKIEYGQEDQSPYSSMANDPVLKNDPNGDCPACLIAIGEFIADVVTVAAVTTTTYLAGKSAVNAAKKLPAAEFDPAKSSGPIGMSSFGGSSLGDIAGQNAQTTSNQPSNKTAPASTEKAQAPTQNKSSEDPTKNRVKLRKETVEQVKENQPRNENGEMIDPNTKQPLTPGKIDVWHKTDQEWHKRKAMHQQKGSTRKEVIETENDPNLYHLEDRQSNQSHTHEEKKSN